VLDLLGDRVTVFVAADPAAGGAVVCFALFVRDRDIWHGLYVGADYRDPRHRGGYFEVGFHLRCRPRRWLGCAGSRTAWGPPLPSDGAAVGRSR
jgi:hypothetical protein